MKLGYALTASVASFAISSVALGQNSGPNLGLGPVALNSAQQMQAAEGPPPQPSMFTVRGGILVPLNNRIADITPVLVGVGVDFTFSNAYIRNGETFVSADWLIRTKSGTRFNLFPFNLNERFYITQRNNENGNVSYAFLGFGATLFDYQGGGSSWRFGGRAGIGEELGPRWVGELAVYASTAFRGVQADALGAYIGYKFGGS